MKANKSVTAWVALAALSSLAGCSSIGDGNGPISMELKVNGESEGAEVFACQVSSPRVEVTFTNGSIGNFFNQGRDVTYSSSNPDVLAVSDGSFPSPDGQFFVPGLLIPIKPGTATITAEYLTFSDSIDVTVSPVSLDITPKTQTLIQGQSVFLSTTGVLDGQNSLSAADFSNLGVWSVLGEEEETSAGTIDASNGLYSAREDAEGVDTVEFAIDFCDVVVSVDVEVLNQSLQSLRLVAADDTDAVLEAINLPPDTSFGVRAIGTYSGGFEQDLTSRSSLLVADDDVAFANLRGAGQLTSFLSAQGQSSTVTASFDPDSSQDGDEIVSTAIPLNVLDVSLDPDSLDITPKDALMLPNTTFSFAVTGDFSGADGDIRWTLTRDVVWSSDEPGIAALLNTNGSRGLAISSPSEVGPVLVAARRVSGDADDALPEVSLTVGALEAEDPVAKIQALRLEAEDEALVQGALVRLSAIADIGPEDETIASQDISSGVVWSSSDPQLASVSNASSSRGVVTVLTDQADQRVTMTARYFDSSRQEERFTQTIELLLNPSPADESEE